MVSGNRSADFPWRWEVGSIVLRLYFKEALLMFADGAYFGSFFADMDMSAITADPDSVTLAREYNTLLDILQQAAVAFLVMFLYRCDSAEAVCYFGKSLSFGILRHF